MFYIHMKYIKNQQYSITRKLAKLFKPSVSRTELRSVETTGSSL